jgi:DNA-binding beta-propeller fold protein YncE
MGGRPPGPPEGGDPPLRGLPGGRARPPGGGRPPDDPPADGGRPGRRPTGEERPLKVLPGGDRPLRVLHPDGKGPPLRVVTDGDGAAPAPDGVEERRDGPDRRPPGKVGRRRWPSRWQVLVVTLVAGLLATIALAGRVSSGGQAPSPQPAPPAQATRPQPATTAPRSPVVATIGTGGFPYGMAFGAGSLWVAGSDHVSRIDPASNRVEATIPFSAGGYGHAAVGPSGLTFGAGAVWAPMAVPGAVWQIDPASNRVVARIPLAGPLRETISVSATRGAVWVAARGEGESGLLFRVDPARLRVVAAIRFDGVPTAVAAGPTAVWVTTAGGRVLQVDPKRNRVTGSVNTGGGPLLGFSQTIALGAGGVWLAEPFAELVVRIDPASRRVVARIPAGAATNLAIGQGAVWVVSSRGLLRIDPGRNRVVASVPAAQLRLTLLATTGGGAVWAAGWNSVSRIDPARVVP